MYDLDVRSWDFQINFFPLHSDIITLLCLIVVGGGMGDGGGGGWVGYTSKGLLTLIGRTSEHH